MNKKRKITSNCEKTTFLIEKKQFGAVSLKENLYMRIHLAGCSVCRIYQRHSRLINDLVKQVLEETSLHARLDEDFMQKLHAKISEVFDRD